jgi:hypothetical protein
MMMMTRYEVEEHKQKQAGADRMWVLKLIEDVMCIMW